MKSEISGKKELTDEGEMEERMAELANEVFCPCCGAPHKKPGLLGWWEYVGGRWCCDVCLAQGAIWESGEKQNLIEDIER